MEYKKLVDIYKKIESTSKRLEKTYYISELLKNAPKLDLQKIVLLIQGKIFPNWDERKIGIASKLVIKAINITTGISTEKIEQEWKKTGDLGIVAQNLTNIKKQQTLSNETLTVTKVFNNLQKLTELEGSKSVELKMRLIAELLSSANPAEARFIVRTLLEDLRVGVGEGSMRDAICWAFFSDKLGFTYLSKENDFQVQDRELYTQYIQAIQNAYDVTNDFSIVADAAKNKDINILDNMNLEPGRPIKVMLAIKVDNIDEGFERVGKPMECEYKYDGFRIQGHKKGTEIKLFTRRLENVTAQFPEVVKCLKTNIQADNFIIDSEAVGYDKKSGKYMPFQNISQRIRRKYDIEEIADKYPVELNIFDVIFLNGKSLINENFEKRHDLLNQIVKEEPKKIMIAKSLITSDKKEVDKFYKKSIDNGNEGLMLKKLDAPYKPGARVGYMVKLKSEKDALDVVIIAAEWGEGKRASMLSSYTISCIDEDGNFLEIGKVSTGLKEKEEEGLTFSQMTEAIRPLIISEKGREVKLKPKIVIEVAYEEIQKSPTYQSGYALRFPRVRSMRIDKDPLEAVTFNTIENLYYEQNK